MKINERYNILRDNLAIGIAWLAKIYDEQQTSHNIKYEEEFQYTMIQLKSFDILWDAILKDL